MSTFHISLRPAPYALCLTLLFYSTGPQPAFPLHQKTDALIEPLQRQLEHGKTARRLREMPCAVRMPAGL